PRVKLLKASSAQRGFELRDVIYCGLESLALDVLFLLPQLRCDCLAGKRGLILLLEGISSVFPLLAERIGLGNCVQGDFSENLALLVAQVAKFFQHDPTGIVMRIGATSFRALSKYLNALHSLKQAVIKTVCIEVVFGDRWLACGLCCSS